ncbi:MAG: hypothetical protein IPJ00_20405 [Saprospirales bacterium]|nr:hypothetical protein [Saprospirales bacterium]
MQYLQAGLAVLATNTKGQSELAAQAEGAVFLVTTAAPKPWQSKFGNWPFRRKN